MFGIQSRDFDVPRIRFEVKVIRDDISVNKDLDVVSRVTVEIQIVSSFFKVTTEGSGFLLEFGSLSGQAKGDRGRCLVDSRTGWSWLLRTAGLKTGIQINWVLSGFRLTCGFLFLRDGRGIGRRSSVGLLLFRVV